MNNCHTINGTANGTHQNGTHQNGTYQNGTANSTNGIADQKVAAKKIVENTTTSLSNDRDSVFLQRIFDVCSKEIFEKNKDLNTKVIDFHHPAELKELMDLSLNEKGVDDDKLIEYCKSTVGYSVRTGHPYFFNQLFSGFNRYGLGGSWITEAMNTSQYTFEVSPVFTLMEDVVLSRMRGCVGWQDGDGIFCPGGSVSNMYGLNLARYFKYPEIKTEGMQGLPKIVAFTSEHSHYSLKKGAAFMGLGTNNIWAVPCNEKGQMIVHELECLIQEALDTGFTPFFINATCGSTVAGAFDDVEAIADVANKYNTWLHVDLCWGGGALLSKKHRAVMKGVDRADSCAWNPHKMMGAPLQCCAFLTKHKDNLLDNCHSANARYLFQQDKFYDVSYDTGDKSLQCGRKVDVFKLWLMWKAKGDQGFEEGINNIYEKAEYMRSLIRNTEGFRLTFDNPESTNVCFWYIPKSLRGQEENEEWRAKLGKVAPIIKERMVMKGSMLVGYQPLGDRVNFFRFIVCNLEISKETIDYAINEFIRLGEDISNL